MGQMGFFDLGNRYSGLDAKNEPLLKIDGVVPWEDLRARLEAGVAACGRRRRAAIFAPDGFFRYGRTDKAIAAR